ARIARRFQRLHRANLVGTGVQPLQFKGSDSLQALGITGDETHDIEGLGDDNKPQHAVTLVIPRRNGETKRLPVLLGIDTPI
ncbi:hypothetical protein AAHH79_37085, partial [Burkholderia pseudomallei]